MQTPAEVRNRIHRLLEPLLAARGFRYEPGLRRFARRRPSGLTEHVWLLTDVPDPDGPVRSTANLGIRGPAASEDREGVDLLIRNVGYLMPARRWREWDFACERFDVGQMQEFAAAVLDRGLPWLESFDDLDVAAAEPARVAHLAHPARRLSAGKLRAAARALQRDSASAPAARAS